MATRNKKLKKKKPETVPCTTCEGSGLVKSIGGTYGVIPCKVCAGTGQLLKFSQQLNSPTGVA